MGSMLTASRVRFLVSAFQTLKLPSTCPVKTRSENRSAAKEVIGEFVDATASGFFLCFTQRLMHACLLDSPMQEEAVNQLCFIHHC